MLIANAKQIRTCDELMMSKYHYLGILLMEHAGRQAAAAIVEKFPNTRQFLIATGKGNNGGDGLVIARYLHFLGKKIFVLLAESPDEFQGDALINYRISSKLPISFIQYNPKKIRDNLYFLHDDTIIIDALLGTATVGAVTGNIADIIDILRGYAHPVIAIDLPSGLSADTGFVITRPLHATYTVTFQLPKICHYVTPASDYCGEIIVIDIQIYPELVAQQGIQTYLLTDSIVKTWRKTRPNDTHKGTYGHALLVGGSKGMAGSIALCTSAALEVGAGLASAFIPASCSCSFHRNTLENMSIAYGGPTTVCLNETAGEVISEYLAEKSCVVIGPGMSVTPDTCEFLKTVLPKIKAPLILDADALNILAEFPEYWEFVPNETIVTPHPGEMSRLAKKTARQIQENRLETARAFAKERNVIVVLKGAGTIIATPDGQAWINSSGNPGMATAGSGDVLAGMIAGFLAQGYSPAIATCLGVYLHAKTGDYLVQFVGQEGITANKILKNCAKTFNQIISS